jgi:hypothetical protein
MTKNQLQARLDDAIVKNERLIETNTRLRRKILIIEDAFPELKLKRRIIRLEQTLADTNVVLDDYIDADREASS